MQRKAIDEAGKAISYAEKALTELQNAPDLEAADRLWKTFLDEFYRVYEALGAGTKGNAKAIQWHKGKLAERHSDELLNYVHWA